MAAVKTSRADKAVVTRHRILDAAYDLFCGQGYRATTMDAIAERAGVAIQTVYFTFRTKDALLQMVLERLVLGPGSVPPPEQAWYRAAVDEPDPRRAAALVVSGLAPLLGQVAPLLPTFHAVTADTAGDAWRRAEGFRRQGMVDLARSALLSKGHVRPGFNRRQAGDLLTVLVGPESYRAYVIDLGWTPKAWMAWTTRSLIAEFFEPAATQPQ